MEGMKRDERLGVTRALIAACFLTFSVSLIPGLFNARLGDLDAFIPEGSGSTLGASATTAEAGNAAFKNNLEGALTAAQEADKLILVNF